MSTPTLPMLPNEVLELALKQEHIAHAFYARLAEESTAPFLTELLVGLRDEEAKHAKMIQSMLAQLMTGATPKIIRR